MTAITSRFVGRPVSAALGERPEAHDKWALVDDLTVAASDFGLSHRAIAVLRIMLTFVPDRDLPARAGKSIVFASNATLSTRLGGMPESTLRRHLAALVQSGVIARFDSPNRKRYVKRLGDGIACAFGFDLGPLALMAGDLRRQAAKHTRRLEEHAVLRARILSARQSLTEALLAQDIDPEGIHAHSPLLGRARLFLRRKDNNEDLRALLNDFETALETPEMIVSDSEIERHQHSKKNNNSESDLLPSTPVDLDVTVQSFAEYRKMFPNGPRDWQELSQHAAQLVPMMGIDGPVYEEAKRFMGAHIAPISILCLLERFDTIQNPGGYLRHLTKQSRNGEFDIKKLIRMTNEAVR
jgi:replication initiation protein RepC